MTVVETAAAVIAVCGALTGVTVLARGGWRVTRRMVRVHDALLGGDGQPGVVDRLDGIEGRLDGIEAELRPNTGASLRDAVTRIERRVDGHLDWHVDAGRMGTERGGWVED